METIGRGPGGRRSAGHVPLAWPPCRRCAGWSRRGPAQLAGGGPARISSPAPAHLVPAILTCHLRPTDGWLPKARRTYGEDDIQVALARYSTAPLNSWTCPAVLGLGKGGMFRSITSPPQHLPSTWAESPMCWVACR